MVCDDEILPSVAKMIFFAGVLVGALGFGILSDVYVSISSQTVSLYLFTVMLICQIPYIKCPKWLIYLILLDFSLTVKAATLIFISGRGSAISSGNQVFL